MEVDNVTELIAEVNSENNNKIDKADVDIDFDKV